MLAWLVEKLAGMPFQDALSKEVWFHIGAESNASYIAPRYGVAVTHGGFMARLRDLARFGLLFTPSYGTVSDRRIISEAHVAFLLNEGNPKLLANADAAMPGFKHSIYQWDAVFADGTPLQGRLGRPGPDHQPLVGRGGGVHRLLQGRWIERDRPAAETATSVAWSVWAMKPLTSSRPASSSAEPGGLETATAVAESLCVGVAQAAEDNDAKRALDDGLVRQLKAAGVFRLLIPQRSAAWKRPSWTFSTPCKSMPKPMPARLGASARAR